MLVYILLLCQKWYPIGPVAQWIERRSTEPEVPGSTPGGIVFCFERQVAVSLQQRQGTTTLPDRGVGTGRLELNS
eukprot:362129-Chlamydomonas_euryale.AAC.1